MFKRISFLVVMTLFLSSSALAQSSLSWVDFADVKFDPKFNDKYGIEFLTPTFGDHIKSYEGKEVTIKGYFLDLTGNGTVFLLSKNPLASCFFCGGAGPETVIEVYFKEKPPYKTDDVVEITGKLQLNVDDVSKANYILNNSTGKTVN